MIGVLLGGGRGERLKPLTDDKPKVMLEIGGRPVLERNLELLTDAGIRDVIVTLYHEPETVMKYFKTGSAFGAVIKYSRQESLLGTAGDIKRIRPRLNSRFVVVYGDNFSNCCLKPVLERHKKNKALATIVLFDRELNPNSGIAGGCARLEPGTGRIVEFTEGKSRTDGYVNAGIYVLEPEILGYILENSVCDFGRDLFPLLIRERKAVYGYEMPAGEYHFGIDTAVHYQRTKAFYKEMCSCGRKNLTRGVRVCTESQR